MENKTEKTRIKKRKMGNETILYNFVCSISPLFDKERLVEKTIEFLAEHFNAKCFFENRAYGKGQGKTRLDFSFLGKKLSLLLQDKDQANVELIRMLLSISENFVAYSEAFKKSKDFATTDRLTGLYNKAYFMGILKRIKQRKEDFCLAMLDLDNFKKFNDRFGHQQGDVVLKKVGEIIASSLGHGEFACRYGGEEFCIIFKSDLRETYKRAEVIRKKIAAINGIVTASIGLVKSSDEPFHFLVKKADALMYEAKRSGKNRVAVASRKRRQGLAGFLKRLFRR